ncbi:MFP1 attachment factor 1-like [Cicer arietinum]|uniref:MFP1 attachment factor 1-like n=1 Tax=Cicer arietinum TaxID=3827 RepID=A0A1S2Y405_CICAR|nr:MFP1 attachment factor 1-like [Cicer arietinum]
MSDPEIKPEQYSIPVPPPSTEAPPLQPNLTASFSIWPPTQRTRDAVINRLIQTFSTPSVLSKRYGTLSADEASTAAHQIEEEAFSAAGTSSFSSDDNIWILQVYSKEISKRMIDTVKSRGSLADTNASSDVDPSLAEDAVAVSDS